MKQKIFNAKTPEAYVFKALVEVLHNTLVDVNMTIDDKEISTLDMNIDGTIMVHSVLKRERFIPPYELSSNTPIKFGFEASHIPKLTKAVKKKDKLSLFFYDDNKEFLNIKIKDSDGNRNNVNIVKTQPFKICNDNPPDFTDHLPTVIIKSNEFQKMCKVMNGISKTVYIKAQDSSIIFKGDTANMYGRTETFGKWNKNKEPIFNMSLPTKLLSSVSKCSSLPLSKQISIYALPGYPLRINCDIGSIGSLDIYLAEPSNDDDDN